MRTLTEDVTSIAQLLLIESLRRGERVERKDIYRSIDRVMIHLFPDGAINRGLIIEEITRRISGWPQQKART